MDQHPLPMPIGTLQAVRARGHERIRARGNAPWTHYRLMQLIEATDELIEGTKVDGTTERFMDRSQKSDEHSDADRLQLENVYPTNIVRLHRDKSRIRMPT